MKITTKTCVNALVLALSTMVALLLCEVAARLFLRSSDYLQVQMVPDEVMGARPSASTLGHGFDAWGFRNPGVPQTADIVAIGDSHTFGNTARMNDSWPYVLQDLTGRRVYNMALGGYGPNQYFHLFETKALGMKPALITCGLYMGDDFENAFLITYGLDRWAYLRKLPPEKVNFDIWEAPPAPTWHKKVRLWLSRHSVTYQLAFHGPLLGRFQGEVQIKNAARLYPGKATSLVIPERHLEEAFLPTGILRRLDQSSPSVQEGMRITFELLRQMNEISRRNNIQFLVVVIPTKETVFADYLEHRPNAPLGDVVDRILVNERQARERTFAFLDEAGIAYVDTLPGLKRSVEHELYARTATDMHPNRNGYRVIAEQVSEGLKKATDGSRRIQATARR